VEGAEADVVAGLTTAVPALSFEYLPQALNQVESVLQRLADIGEYAFNWSLGESYRLEAGRWLGADGLVAALSGPSAQRRSGDVYARLVKEESVERTEKTEEIAEF
jgi:hypothetical protein